MSLERFRKSPCSSLSVRVIQREVTFQKLLTLISEKSSSYYWPRSGGGRKGAAIRASMLTEALKPVNLNLLIGVERARSESEEPPNSSESLLTTNRSGREFYWHWLWRRGGQCFCAHETTMSMICPARLRGVRTNKSDCRFPAGRDDSCEVVRRSQIYTCKLATCKFWDRQCKRSVSSFTENIFENSRKCFSLCWVLVRSRNFRDVEQRRRLCKTRVFFSIL